MNNNETTATEQSWTVEDVDAKLAAAQEENRRWNLKREEVVDADTLSSFVR